MTSGTRSGTYVDRGSPRSVTVLFATAGFAPTARVVTLKITGDDEPGIGARIASAVATAGVNVRGFSASVINGQFACHLGFDTGDDAARASASLREEFRREP